MNPKKKRRPRIAVIDDAPDFRAMVSAWLSPRYEPVEFESAEELLESGPDELDADLVITDVRMSGIDGFRLCEVLRSHPRSSHVPVLFLTGVEPAEGIFWGQDAGGSAYLHKPIERDQLLEQIEKLLDKDAL